MHAFIVNRLKLWRNQKCADSSSSAIYRGVVCLHLSDSVDSTLTHN